MHGHRVLGAKLKRLRIRAGLTQEQLAQLVDCSDRLIRRAEGSLPVRYDTLERVAAVLSDHGLSIAPGDLVSSHLAIAKRFWKVLGQYEYKLPDHFPYLVSDVRWIVSGNSKSLPFAGQCQGIDKVRQNLELFYETIKRKPSLGQPLFLETDRHISIKHIDQWRRTGKHAAKVKVWVNWHLTFCDGMIRRVEHHYDTLAVYQLFSDI